jgi:hypothetical protein
MKKLFPLFLIVVLMLSACNVFNPVPAQPTPSDEQLATRVAQILTSMPAPSQVVSQPTAESPTQAPAEPTPTASETPIPPADTEAPAPLSPGHNPDAGVTPTALVEVDQAGGGFPTATLETPQAGGGNPAGTTVSNLINTPVPGTSTPPPTLTAPASTLAAGDPRLRLGNPAFSDPMDNGNNWPSGIDPAGFTSLVYNNGQMQLTSLKTRSGWRLSTYGTDLTDFYVEMRISTLACKGNDRYGIYFRVPNKSLNNQGYWFGFTCDGRYALQKWDGTASPDGVVTNLIYWTNNSAINAGSNQTNRLGVMAIGSRIYLYANGKLLAQRDDSTWLQGAFGIFVGARETSNLTILVDQVDVWRNPIAP